MDSFYLDDSDHNNLIGSDDALQTVAEEETGLDLDTALLPGPQQSGPEVAVGAPSHEAGQPSTFNFESLLAHAMRNVAESPVQLPWESDEWACIFDPNHDSLDALVPQFEPKLKVPKLIHDKPSDNLVSQPDVSSSDFTKPLFMVAVSRRKDQVWTEKREAELQRALMKWDTIVRNWPDEWKCKQELLACPTVNDSMNLLGDYLTGKAPATLLKRANSMVFLHTTLQQLGFFWPLEEPEMYRIIKTLHSTGNRTSRLKSILEAVTFCRYSFDISDLHPITVSKRCLGATGSDFANKLNQASPLTVADIWHLHTCLDNGDAWDRVFSGAALFCIYARARWSDFIHGNCIRVDVLESSGKVAYVDMEVQIHKTMQATANKFKFLDLVASGSGIFGDDWVRGWIDALKNIGVDPFSNEPGKTLMPAPAEDGTTLQRALESNEASVWLMADTYARDAQARTIRLIDKLLLEIRAGYFDPDTTRAGRFNKNYAPDPSLDVGAVSFLESDVESAALDAQVDEALDNAVQTVEDGQIELEEDHFTSSSSDSEAESVEYNAPVRMFYPPSAPLGFHFMQNKRTKTLHLVDAKYPHGTCCGRVLDKNFSAMWTILARELSTVKPDNTGKRPLDEAILKLMHDPRITMYMLSLPNKGPASSVQTRPASTAATTPTTVQPKKKARPSKKNRHLDSLPNAEEEFTFANQSETVSHHNLLQEMPNTPEGAQLEDGVTDSSDAEQQTAEKRFTEDPSGATTRKVLFENILFLEVFAGTSSLTIEVRKTNLRGVAVDKGTERAKGPITILDLTMPEDLQFLMDFIRQEVWCSAFFDDFPTMAADAEAAQTDKCVGFLFDLLGIQYAKEGKKNQPFSTEMRALGLIFDLAGFDEGVVFIKHTPERRSELLERITAILNSDELSPKEAESFRGRVQWFESFLFGRTANLAIHRLGKRALIKGGRQGHKLDAELRTSLEFLRHRVEHGAPLQLTATTEQAILIFTDGAFDEETGIGSIGGVLLDHTGTALSYFSERVPNLLMELFLKEAENPIYLVELLAVHVAAFLWGGQTFGRYIVMYIDNEASRMALVKAYSSTLLGNVVIQLFVQEEDQHQWKVWFGRVCSHSNIADGPSRGHVEDMKACGAKHSQCAWDVVICSLEAVEHRLRWG
ncbi:unnamed protein product [Cladocopium goreaui]|uniref:Uncharacterized protein n=1 Tax=Cladocopium goreaui TaxID=2562237 RepID=A0A9P1FJ62_9DINO|nr:unnamed protein product [Cladocopium goreaui]